MTQRSIKLIEKYENSHGTEKEFWLGYILALYARWSRSYLADEIANSIFDRTSQFMLKKYSTSNPSLLK